MKCKNSNVRAESCMCANCSRGTTPAAKQAANIRDIKAILDHLAGCVDNHPTMMGTPTWSSASDVARLRAKLVEVAAYFVGDVMAHGAVDDALCADDTDVVEALIETV